MRNQYYAKSKQTKKDFNAFIKTTNKLHNIPNTRTNTQKHSHDTAIATVFNEAKNNLNTSTYQYP